MVMQAPEGSWVSLSSMSVVLRPVSLDLPSRPHATPSTQSLLLIRKLKRNNYCSRMESCDESYKLLGPGLLQKESSS